MEIDFHFSTTYVLSRMAGFSPEEANTIAYSSQYVDDAGTYFASSTLKVFEWHAIFFEDYGIFEYIDSSHSMYDLSNWKELDQHKVWMPFHFLPAAKGNTFSKKAVCHKAWDIEAQWNNPLAEDMAAEVVNNAGKPANGLHRLGITMHTLADTFAHQRFAAIKDSTDNKVSKIEVSPEGYKPDKSWSLIGHLPALGHAQAEHLPDIPYVRWSYTDSNGRKIIRNNPEDYTDAIDIMFRVLQEYRKKFKGGQGPNEDDIYHDRGKIISFFTEFTDKDGATRNKKWIQQIKNNAFQCCDGNEKADYYAEGENKSWWDEVKRLCPRSSFRDHPEWYVAGYRQFNEGFMNCNYKLFQDALKSHLYYVSKILYPKYNICAL